MTDSINGIDARTFMLVKAVDGVERAAARRDQQVIEFGDFRDVDGVKVPYRTRSSNAVQSGTATATEVKHNVDVDDALFGRPD